MRRIDLVEHNVLFITDEAGTGKTNFLCDFILHFLLPNHIPTFFFTSQDVYFHGGDVFLIYSKLMLFWDLSVQIRTF